MLKIVTLLPLGTFVIGTRRPGSLKLVLEQLTSVECNLESTFESLMQNRKLDYTLATAFLFRLFFSFLFKFDSLRVIFPVESCDLEIIYVEIVQARE